MFDQGSDPLRTPFAPPFFGVRGKGQAPPVSGQRVGRTFEAGQTVKANPMSASTRPPSIRIHATDVHSKASNSDLECDPQLAISRLGGKRSLYANVVGRFLDDSAQYFVRLRRAVIAEDLPAIQQTAHCLKGVAAMCGASRVEATLSELEATALQMDLEPLKELSDRLETEMSSARAALDPYRQPSS